MFNLEWWESGALCAVALSADDVSDKPPYPVILVGWGWVGSWDDVYIRYISILKFVESQTKERKAWTEWLWRTG